jgi:hypothetical protein
MEKIMIVTSQLKSEDGLLALVKELFPECEIQIVFKRADTSEQFQVTSFSGPVINKIMGRA